MPAIPKPEKKAFNNRNSANFNFLDYTEGGGRASAAEVLTMLSKIIEAEGLVEQQCTAV